MIQLGRYDRRIVFVYDQSIPDGFGGFIPNNQSIRGTFAAVRQIKASNNLEAFELGFPKLYEFRIKKRPSFIPTTQLIIRYNGNIHIIKSITENEERNSSEWIITAEFVWP
jgi:hypothetical protein